MPLYINVEGTLSVVIQLRNTDVVFMFHYNNQTDKGDETEGLERMGSERIKPNP